MLRPLAERRRLHTPQCAPVSRAVMRPVMNRYDAASAQRRWTPGLAID